MREIGPESKRGIFEILPFPLYSAGTKPWLLRRLYFATPRGYRLRDTRAARKHGRRLCFLSIMLYAIQKSLQAATCSLQALLYNLEGCLHPQAAAVGYLAA